MAPETADYRLSCELRGHEDDVRGICICGDSGFATSSRDKTVRFWAPDPDKKYRYVLSKTLAGHSSFVGPLAWIPPGDRFPEGGIVSGGMDTQVLLWDLSKGELMETMKGHQFQVTGLAVDDNGDIISSSIDCTIRRWRKGHAIEFWEAHKVSVQAVIKLPSGELVTGSSDTTLKLWRGRTCLHTFTGHTDTVRGLAVMPGLGILSASHDCSIKLWALTGQVLMEMIGHSSLVYSVDANSSGLVASGSEDCFLKIWKDGVCIQSIEHPGCVWDVKFLENGDIITACSDGTVRIWALDNDRICDAQEFEAYAIELSLYKSKRKKVGGLNLTDLPGLEALQVPGTTDGQTKVIREGDNGVAYSWNSKEYKWGKIGEVVDGPGDSTTNQILDGVRYDYVFNVDIGDGEPVRKLPYNMGDNPYATADKWLLKENLPLSYRQQIVEFILQNTGQQNFSLDTSFRDPYTGASAYIPGEPSVPFGTALKPTFKHIPKKGMLLSDSAQFDGILKKLSEFNTVLLSDVAQKSLSLTELELSRLTAIIKILKDASHYHCSKFADADIILLLKILKSWPLSMMFPVIDILRMVILHPDGATLLLKHIENGNDILMEAFKRATTAPSQPANLLTIMRAITNLFKHSYFSNWLQSHYSEVAEWGKMSMCDAERRLLANALLDLSNERFVLLSESCIPLYNFSIIYQYLVRSKYSFVGSFDDPGPHGRGRYHWKMAPEVNIMQWRKGAQWFEVDRKLAISMISDVKYYPKFRDFCKPACYVDEHYFPTMLAIEWPRLIANRAITWIDWSRGGAHPATFGKGDITEVFLKNILDGKSCSYNNQRSSVCFLFARKFAPSALEPLLHLTPTLLGFK